MSEEMGLKCHLCIRDHCCCHCPLTVGMVKNSLGISVTFNDLLSSFDSTFRIHLLPKLGKLDIDSRLLIVPWSSYHRKSS